MLAFAGVRQTLATTDCHRRVDDCATAARLLVQASGCAVEVTRLGLRSALSGFGGGCAGGQLSVGRCRALAAASPVTVAQGLGGGTFVRCLTCPIAALLIE